MTRAMHLTRFNGGTMGFKSACGRNVVNTPMSTGWEEFKDAANQCARCVASPFFSKLVKKDDAAIAESIAAWVPVDDPDAWIAQDAAAMAAHRAAK